MSYYEPQSPAGWQQNQARQSWDARSTVSTPGAQASFNKGEVHGNPMDLTTRFTAQVKPEDPAAFGSQIDEVDRAVDNLVKSGKMFTAPRRDSMPMMGPRGFPVGVGVEAHDPRLVNPIAARHYSVTEFDALRSPSAANLQNFYATQRFAPRPGAEPETVIQAKRRAAAQRERELRNYHQEQQYNRTVMAEISSFGKNTTTAQAATLGAAAAIDGYHHPRPQHAAVGLPVFGGIRSPALSSSSSSRSNVGHLEDGSNHPDDQAAPARGGNLNMHPNGASAPASNAGGTRGPSPLAAFGPLASSSSSSSSAAVAGGAAAKAAAPGTPVGGGGASDVNPPVDAHAVQTPASEHPPTGTQSTGTVSPNHARTNSGVHGLSNRTTASSPGGSPPRSNRGSVGPTNSAVAPIGTRPAQAQNPAVNNVKRATTPLASPLSYGFGATEADPFNNNHNKPADQRSASAASNSEQSSSAQNAGASDGGSNGLGWGKVWGPGNKGLTNVASVWG